jgi:hypothetical protein
MEYQALVAKNNSIVEKIGKNKHEILCNFHFPFEDKEKWFDTISNCLSKDFPYESCLYGRKVKQTKFKFNIATISYQINNIKCKYISDDGLTMILIYPNEAEIEIFEQLYNLHTKNISNCEFFEIDEDNKKYLRFLCSYTDKIRYFDNDVKVDFLQNESIGIGKFIFTFLLREEFDCDGKNIKNKLRIKISAGKFVKN